MRNLPDDEAELQELRAEPWMVKLLTLNPEYTSWGPHEDYMIRDAGWEGRVLVNGWAEFDWKLNVLNECVNFYFEVLRSSKSCSACEGSGYNPPTKQLADDFYDFAGRGTRWRDQITQSEVDALIAEGREKTGAVAEQVNEAQKRGFGHDAINQHILIEARGTRLGVYGFCEQCDGEGREFTEPAAHVNLVLWMIHPRKGCSRGIEISYIEQRDLPAIFEWLKEAAQRNATRFAALNSTKEL